MAAQRADGLARTVTRNARVGIARALVALEIPECLAERFPDTLQLSGDAVASHALARRALLFREVLDELEPRDLQP